MPTDPDHSLESRLEDLEARVRTLERDLRREEPPSVGRKGPVEGKESSESAGRPAVTEGPVVRRRRVDRRSRSRTASSIQRVLRSEDLINKVGIFLLLVGMAFLFKWGIDRGWITPIVRVAFGAAVGLFLVVAGTRIRTARARFGRVLVGGGLATLYITLFAAFQLYGLLTYAVAFTLMTGVTALSFGLSLRESDVALAIIATAGGLGTPFLLFEAPGSILWLVVYTCVIAVCAVAIHFEKGWRSLLMVAVVGGWSVLTYVWLEIADVGYVPLADRLAYQLGVAVLLAAFGLAPAVRDWAARRRPDRWTSSPVPTSLRGWVFERPALWLSVVAPLVSLALSHEVWDLSPAAWGAVEVIVATAYWAVHLFVKGTGQDDLASSAGVAAALLLAVSWFHLFDSESLRLLALAGEATAIHVATHASTDRPLRILGHLMFLVVAVWMAGRLLEGTDTPTLFSPWSAVHLAVLLLASAASITIRSGQIRSTYRVGVALLLAVAWLTFFRDGSTRFLALSLQAAAIILWTQYFRDRGLRLTAHGLFVVSFLVIYWRLSASSGGSPPLVNLVALVDLAVIIVAVGCSFLLNRNVARLAYRFGAYVAYLGWFWRDLAPIENGHAFISLAWGATAVVLIMIGWRSGRDLVRVTGLTTLGVVVIKLFVVDLAELDAGWRVVLFIGLGGLLLASSYLFPSVWRGDATELKASPTGREPDQSDE